MKHTLRQIKSLHNLLMDLYFINIEINQINFLRDKPMIKITCNEQLNEKIEYFIDVDGNILNNTCTHS